MNKVVIIGTGFVGSSIAYALSLRNNVQSIYLINREQEMSAGERDDINHGFNISSHPVLKGGDYSDVVDADYIIISAGRNRKPGESRNQLLTDNSVILKSIISQLKLFYSTGKIIIVTNPVDILTQKVHEWMGLEWGQVIGTGTLLDTSRLRFKLSMCDLYSNAEELLIGEHGEGLIAVEQSFHPKSNFFQDMQFKQTIMEEINGLGASIIRNKGKTHFGIATAVSFLLEQLESETKVTLPISLPLVGQFDQHGCSLSLPYFVSKDGITLNSDILISKSELIEFAEVKAKLDQFLDTLET